MGQQIPVNWTREILITIQQFFHIHKITHVVVLRYHLYETVSKLLAGILDGRNRIRSRDLKRRLTFHLRPLESHCRYHFLKRHWRRKLRIVVKLRFHLRFQMVTHNMGLSLFVTISELSHTQHGMNE